MEESSFPPLFGNYKFNLEIDFGVEVKYTFTILPLKFCVNSCFVIFRFTFGLWRSVFSMMIAKDRTKIVSGLSETFPGLAST